jgi:23S rRNA (adenine2503-C2)-methyltransferase
MASPPGSDLLDLPFPALAREMSGLSPVHTRKLWSAIHREGATDLASRTDFQPPLRRWMDAVRPTLAPLAVERDIPSGDGLTRKFLLRLRDGHTIETVLMGYPGRFTACISTQVGCAMGCVFCATGQAGFTRHLAPGEIVAQVLHCQRILRTRGEIGLRNLVFMGMGEPLHNYDAVMTALESITDTRGLNIGPRRISISTVGVIPGILRLAEENRPYNLAVSLHGATPGERAALVPVSKRWPLDELLGACRTYTAKTGRKIFFGWTLIAGENDSPQTAAKLAALLDGIPAHVNLIPLNPTDGYGGVASGRATEFQSVLRAAGIPSTVRQRRGIDVAAGCGQLKAGKIFTVRNR